MLALKKIILGHNKVQVRTGFLLEQGHRDHCLPILCFIPAIFTWYTKDLEQINHVVPAKVYLVPPNQVLNKIPVRSTEKSSTSKG